MRRRAQDYSSRWPERSPSNPPARARPRFEVFELFSSLKEIPREREMREVLQPVSRRQAELCDYELVFYFLQQLRRKLRCCLQIKLLL